MKQLMIYGLLFFAALFTTAAVNAAPGSISGTLTDEHGNPIVSGSVTVMQGNTIKGGAITDFDGKYSISPLDSGRYDIKFSAQGVAQTVTGVVVSAGNSSTVNLRLVLASNVVRGAVMVRAARRYQRPLIDRRRPGGVYQSKNSGQISLGGGRVGTNTVYIVDGVQLSGGNGTFTTPSSANTPVPNTESYKKEEENGFKNVQSSPLSTLSVDVDRASYSNIRRFINEGQKPPADAVRVEEMINYFEYEYPQPTGSAPIAITTELTTCPWNTGHKLLHIGIQARKIDTEQLPASNLVFLIDVSGSMDDPNKLPLVIDALKLLVDNLREKDKVSIVVYAGSAGLALSPTSGSRKTKINDVLDNLSAGGSTAGGQGIELAYKVAEQQFIKGGNNRVILATDGDFNVGISNDNDLETLITEKRGKGIYLTCLGFGMGNYKDSKMEMLADKGNGNYAYIDDLSEARKTLVHEFGGTLFTVAKDVKAQIEFNPAKIKGYRLIGYENRVLNTEDFKDDKKDAGDMGSGHSVTILYELIPAGMQNEEIQLADPLKYQQSLVTASDELANVKFRYKEPDGLTSKEIIQPVADNTFSIARASENFRFCSYVRDAAQGFKI